MGPMVTEQGGCSFEQVLLSILLSRCNSVVFFPFCREKKREKERDELWKRLAELELNHTMKSTAITNSPANKK